MERESIHLFASSELYQAKEPPGRQITSKKTAREEERMLNEKG